MKLLVLCLVTSVISEATAQHNVSHISRKVRANSVPFETGYFTGAVDYPGVSTNYLETDGRPRVTSKSIAMDPYSHQALSRSIDKSEAKTKTFLPKRDLTVIEKSTSKLNPELESPQEKTDAMYLKSAKQYESEYHIDDNDIRTSSRELHDSWPYYYYNPHEYDHIRTDVEKEKAKDKRYAVDAAKVIPIYEDLSDDIPYSQGPLLTTTESYFTSTDNPMSGHDPFFSVMLKDYFNKDDDYGDQLTMSGIDWNSDGSSGHESNRIRRLPSDTNNSENRLFNVDKHHQQNDFRNLVEGGSATEKILANKHNFNKHEKSDSEKANDQSSYHQNGLRQIGFKDFADVFANKFGSEDREKDSKYIMRINKDTGEKRKGFRRVYHKDEYQEDNEFYDNNNSSAMAEDKGSSHAHIGGSEGVLKSTSFANLGNEASAYDKSGDKERNSYLNNHSGHDNNNRHNKQFDRFRDVAKQAAYSNYAEY